MRKHTTKVAVAVVAAMAFMTGAAQAQCHPRDTACFELYRLNNELRNMRQEQIERDSARNLESIRRDAPQGLPRMSGPEHVFVEEAKRQLNGGSPELTKLTNACLPLFENAWTRAQYPNCIFKAHAAMRRNAQ